MATRGWTADDVARIAAGVVRAKFNDAVNRVVDQTAFIIEIPDTPPSQNQFNTWHWARKAKVKKEWERQIIKYGYFWNNPPAKTVKVTLYFPSKRRVDADNHCHFKALLDGLVKAGIIADDNSKAVDIQYEIKTGTGERKTLIEVSR